MVLADKDGQFAILKLCEPLWEAAKGKNMVVVGPTARFITGSCCEDSTHVANRANNDFYNKMREELNSSCKNIKDFLFTGGFRNGRIMDPARALLGLTAAEIWDSDPIHPKADIYNILAKSVIQVELTCGSGQAKRKRSQRDGSRTFAGREGGGGRGGGGRTGRNRCSWWCQPRIPTGLCTWRRGRRPQGCAWIQGTTWLGRKRSSVEGGTV